jgi:hypothetical protein
MNNLLAFGKKGVIISLFNKASFQMGGAIFL